MSTRDDLFLQRWRNEKNSYLLWGQFVIERIQTILSKSLDEPSMLSFIRIPPVPRIKDEEALLQKAFYRDKGYANPYDDIEDKVGVRFVVLLEADVQILREKVEAETACWSSVKARDHETEIASNPYEFVYQSVHFVVRSTEGQFFGDNGIPEAIPCEIQIRTLLQHAYSEVTHDTIYKPSVRTTPVMKRAAAKSMALIEATGDYFTTLDQLIAAQVRPLQNLNAFLEARYEELVGVPSAGPKSPLNGLLLDRYGHGIDLNVLHTWLKTHAYVGDRIAARRDASSCFRIPAVLLLYFAVGTTPMSAQDRCPAADTDLTKIYSDLGDSLGS
jgi:putative GTP pyrophosphokinase